MSRSKKHILNKVDQYTKPCKFIYVLRLSFYCTRYQMINKENEIIEDLLFRTKALKLNYLFYPSDSFIFECKILIKY